MIAEVIINSTAKELNKTFDYIVPESLEGKAEIGSRVLVSFGPKKIEEAYIISFKENSEYATKDILKVEDNILTKENIELAALMARRYFCNISDTIKLMLPPGNTNKKIENRINAKTGNFVYLKQNGSLRATTPTSKQQRILDFLKENNGIYISDLERVTDTSRAIIKTLEKNGYIEIVAGKIERNPFINKKVKKDKPLNLNSEQQEAYNKIMCEQKFNEFLIYGITGSGKTEIYLQLIGNVLKSGKTAIVLVPEISLTPQMIERFLARFGEQIAVLHSRLSPGERYDEWHKIKSGRAKIVIGARSAIFAPVSNLGIIIIDEEHDLSYKSDMTPRYNAKDIAKYIAKQNNIPLVLGSATPDITTFARAKAGKIELITLSSRANNSNLPNVQIIDLRQELANGNHSMLSESLQKRIAENIKNKKQTILFLNRRGYSTFVMCRDCGHTAKCRKCNISLTYHKNDNKLRCHYCGYTTNVLTICPVCRSKNIKYFGTGTQKLETEIKKLFPEAATIRMDIDTVTKKNSHENILNEFKNNNIDILIGTQMVVKGHHFPNVTLVGVIAADSSLNIEDFRSNERTFALLVQVAGRAGREQEEGNVIIQTYNPDNFVVQYAKEQDYDKFYNTEIAIRKQLNYPPFCDIIMFGISSTDKTEIENASKKLYNTLQTSLSPLAKGATRREQLGGDSVRPQNLNIFPPVSAPIDKIKNRYRWRIIVKCRLNNNIIDLVNNSLEDFYKLKLKNVAVIVDVNPSNLM
ncbi:MAG: primosomal protein N' [Firmicutes bacterium]|nr:primosomal protein N' [Bacillota bacterium]